MDNLFETYCSSFLITVNEPALHGYTHDYIRSALQSCQFSGLMTYCCMCDEVMKSTGKLHTHAFVTFEHPVPASFLVFLLPFAHVGTTSASSWEMKNYILKKCSYKLLLEYEENLNDTFQEWGTVGL